MNAPLDDTVTVDVEEKKSQVKDEDGKYHFHYEFDSTPVVVDDKKALVEEA